MTTPIRLLAVSGATEWGGAEIVLGQLLGALGDHVRPTLLGVDVDVVSKIAAHRPGMPWSVIPAVAGKRDVKAVWAQRRAMAATNPDIVQINLPVPAADPYTVIAALTLPRARVIVVEHLPMAFPSRRTRLLKRLSARRLAAHIAVGSAAATEVAVLSGLPAGVIRVVPNGVPVPATVAAPRLPDGRFVVGGIGRLHGQKGFDVLVRAVARIPEADLVLVGDGPERGALESLAQDLGLGSRLSVTGWTESAASYLAGIDVVAIPSRFEGLPLVLLEAMLSGAAIVATPVGSITDAVRDGETGLLVAVDDVDALERGLRRLMEDPALRTRLGAAARELAGRRFTVSVMARAYEQIYDEVLHRR